jgi:hypothetical protein
VQALPSLQEVPSGAGWVEHWPVDGLQEPPAWHGSVLLQTTGFEPTQRPAWQESERVQALPSLQEVPSGAGRVEQPPVAGSQMPPIWHGSLLLQATGFEPTQEPLWQVSVWVQALPSLHAVPDGATGFEQAPVDGLQEPATWH